MKQWTPEQYKRATEWPYGSRKGRPRHAPSCNKLDPPHLDKCTCGADDLKAELRGK